MSTYDDLPERLHSIGLWRGFIATTAAALDERVYVTLPEYDVNLRWGPCRWMPRFYITTVDVAETGEGAHDITYLRELFPTRGDSCLVGFDNIKEPWILVWWPYE